MAIAKSASSLAVACGTLALIALDDGVDGDRLAGYAEQLGRTADHLAASDPLSAPARVLEALQGVRASAGCPALSPTRLVRLAAAASARAAVSSRLDLYPRGMPAERALKLSQRAQLGARELTVEPRPAPRSSSLAFSAGRDAGSFQRDSSAGSPRP